MGHQGCGSFAGRVRRCIRCEAAMVGLHGAAGAAMVKAGGGFCIQQSGCPSRPSPGGVSRFFRTFVMRRLRYKGAPFSRAPQGVVFPAPALAPTARKQVCQLRGLWFGFDRTEQYWVSPVPSFLGVPLSFTAKPSQTCKVQKSQNENSCGFLRLPVVPAAGNLSPPRGSYLEG